MQKTNKNRIIFKNTFNIYDDNQKHITLQIYLVFKISLRLFSL